MASQWYVVAHENIFFHVTTFIPTSQREYGIHAATLFTVLRANTLESEGDA